jgi:hypothetical protein
LNDRDDGGRRGGHRRCRGIDERGQRLFASFGLVLGLDAGFGRGGVVRDRVGLRDSVRGYDVCCVFDAFRLGVADCDNAVVGVGKLLAALLAAYLAAYLDAYLAVFLAAFLGAYLAVFVGALWGGLLGGRLGTVLSAFLR